MAPGLNGAVAQSSLKQGQRLLGLKKNEQRKFTDTVYGHGHVIDR